MANYDEMWNIMENNSFELDPQSMNNWICIICHKLLIDGCEGPCGCIYCKKCIEKFLDRNEQKCPSGSDECILDFIDLRSNIKRNNNANKRISQLQIKCPSNSCNFKCKLIQMCDHIKVCEKQFALCPLAEMGCIAMEMEKDKISDHLSLEMFHHSKIMIEWMSNMKNEIISFIATKLKESNDLKIDLLTKLIDSEMSKLRVKIEHNRIANEEIINKLHKDILSINYKNEILMKESIEMFNNTISQYKNELVMQNREIAILKKSKNEMENKLKILKIKFSNMNLSRNELIDDKEINVRNLCQQTTKLELNNSSQSKLNMKDKRIASLRWPISDLLRLSDVSLIDKVFDSPKFYSNDNRYEMWLKLYTNGCSFCTTNESVCVRFLITNRVEAEQCWPLKCIVAMTMISRGERYSFKQHFTFYEPNDKLSLLEGSKLVLSLLFSTSQVDYFHFVKSLIIDRESTIFVCDVELGN